MYRIMYMSTALIKFTDEELETLLETARVRNANKNVTGLLIIKGRTFLQCLEGKKEDVLEVFERIKKDGRHDSIIDLIEEDDGERYFPDWSMGYKNIQFITDFKTQKLKDFSEGSQVNSFNEDDIAEIFKEFVQSS